MFDVGAGQLRIGNFMIAISPSPIAFKLRRAKCSDTTTSKCLQSFTGGPIKFVSPIKDIMCVLV